ncbi:hypothetical protein IFM89_034225 [Coptis chinensis]|uniref:UBC core domain-containing protein n=1 Tax=Coptis chinensis TaxID=261450 RepID=A0A835HAI6_9MAGN|nr:hypothetical protein IFM89_034225 [Coptis chinensis]
MEIEEDEVNKKYRSFQKFDVITANPSDHHYIEKSSKKIKDTTIRRIASERKILENGLPNSIFVRAYEKRIDLMRAVIVGSNNGTPYSSGLFFFDIWFPSDYPNAPPKFYYHSHGIDLHPKLYENGKVCVSILNTWNGQEKELWRPEESNILKALEAIQAKVLNAKPYSENPDNNRVFVLSCKSMLYTLQNPPKHFEYFVKGHFRKHAQAILLTCKEYMKNGESIDGIVKRLYNAFEENGAYCKHLAYLVNKENGIVNYEADDKVIRRENSKSREQKKDSDKDKHGALRMAWMKLWGTKESTKELVYA